jgi:L-asparaginase
MLQEYPIVEIDTATPEKPLSSVLIIYTGGTLGMVENASGILVPLDFTHILQHIPALRTLKLHLSVVSFKNPIDSSDITPEHWVRIAELVDDQYDAFDGFVILHGTDTMAYTASALSFMLEGLSKPVILTGAQLPISAPRSDGRENLITALEIAVAKENGQSIVPEVGIFFDDVLLRGNRSRKVESMYFDAFESENHPPLAEAGISITYRREMILRQKNRKLKVNKKFSGAVGVLRLFPGLEKSFVEAVLSSKGLKGLVLETYGSGNAPTADWFFELMEKAVLSGIIIFNVSQCMGGRVMQGKYHTSQRLKNLGVISGKDITTEAALAKMMLLLGTFENTEKVKHLLSSPICGEISDVEII